LGHWEWVAVGGGGVAEVVAGLSVRLAACEGGLAVRVLELFELVAGLAVHGLAPNVQLAEALPHMAGPAMHVTGLAVREVGLVGTGPGTLDRAAAVSRGLLVSMNPIDVVAARVGKAGVVAQIALAELMGHWAAMKAWHVRPLEQLEVL